MNLAIPRGVLTELYFQSRIGKWIKSRRGVPSSLSAASQAECVVVWGLFSVFLKPRFYMFLATILTELCDLVQRVILTLSGVHLRDSNFIKTSSKKLPQKNVHYMTSWSTLPFLSLP